MDYDLTDIAATYDRGHDHGSDVLEQWMTVLESHVDSASIHKILDLACGTGRYAPALAERFHATVIGLDPSKKMLTLAKRHHVRGGRVVLAFGYGEAIPLQAQSVDMVFISMVFHHFDDPVLVARECERVLRPGGRVCLRAITFEQIANYPYLPFFPASRPLLEQRLPSVAATCRAFETASLRTLFTGIVEQQIAPDLATYAEKLSTRTDSVLTSLAPEDFAAGLKSIRASHEAGDTPAPVTEPIDFMVFEKEGRNE